MFDYTIGGLFEKCARSYGPRDAIVQGDLRVTFDELLVRVRRAGRALLEVGLHPGDRVALLMPDRPEVLYAYYGALWAGLAVVPLNAKLGEEDQDYILRDSGARAVVHDAAYADRIAKLAPAAGVEFLLSVDAEAVLDGGLPFEALCARQPDGPGAPTVTPGRPVRHLLHRRHDGPARRASPTATARSPPR